MRNVGLFAFGLTTAVLVPTALHSLTAGPKQVAKLTAPGARTMEIGTATIHATTDRALVDAGDKVRVKLTASSVKATNVNVEVLVMESMGSGGGRVELPPNRIARETVTLRATPDGTTKEVAFTLRGFRASEMEGVDRYGHYTILVMEPKAADSFEKLRRQALKNAKGKEMFYDEAFMNAWHAVGNDSETRDGDGEESTEPSTIGKPGDVARLEVSTRSPSSSVAMEFPKTAVHPNAAFDVHVKVKNPTGKKLEGVTVRLEPGEQELAGEYLGLASDAITIESTLKKTDDDDAKITLAPRETKDIVFHVTAASVGTLGLYASAKCYECDWKLQQKIEGMGALDAIDVVPADTNPIVGKR